MNFQHLTTEEKATQIKETGFSLDFVGTNGGDQMGEGIYLTQHVENWKIHLDDKSLVSLEVEVDMENIINYTEIDQEAAREWMIRNEWQTGNEKSVNDLPEKTWHLIKKRGDAGTFKFLTTLYLKDAGFSGYWYQDEKYKGYFEQLVIWDLEAIQSIR